jgi:drug/metabolite transporter (DMT)-like permease
VSQPETAPPEPQPIHTRWLWVLVALGSHTGWASYPVFARYLQTVSGLPSMALLAACNALALLVLAPFLLPQLERGFLRSRLLWLLAGAVVLRAITNMLAARFALAIYVQLAALSTPFLVVLLGTTLFREPIPRYTLPAMLLSLCGSLLMLSSGSGGFLLQFALSSADLLGMLLSLTSSGFLALYMLLIRRSAERAISARTVFFVQLLAIAAATLLLSLLLGEDWGRWAALSGQDWLIFLLFSIGVFVGSNIANISALRHLGAPFVSSLLGWRLVITLGLAALLLGERLQTLWQALGALIVLVTITWYVRSTRTPH